MSALGEAYEQYADFPQRERALTFGVWIFLLTEILLFSALFALYAAYRAMYGQDFVDAVRHNTWGYGTLNMYILLTSSFTVALAGAAVEGGRRRTAALCLGVTILLGVAFLIVKGLEYARHVHEGALPGPYFHFAEQPTLGANRFYTMYWVMTGIHALHVTAGLFVVGWLMGRTLRFDYTVERHVGLEMGTLYWHLVDIIWILLWPLMYLV